MIYYIALVIVSIVCAGLFMQAIASANRGEPLSDKKKPFVKAMLVGYVLTALVVGWMIAFVIVSSFYSWMHWSF